MSKTRQSEEIRRKPSRASAIRSSVNGLARQFAIIPIILLLASQSSAQPQGNLKPDPQTVPLNRCLHLTLEVMWAGDVDLYDIPQPDFSELTEFEVTERSLSATRKGDKNHLIYEFTMKPLEQGRHDLASIKAIYFEKDMDTPTLIPLPLTIVNVAPPERIPRTAKIAVAVGGVLAICAFVAISFIRSKKDSQQADKRQTDVGAKNRADLLAKLDSAHSLKIDGDLGTYLEKLWLLADSEALRPHVAKIDELHELMENVKYGGYAPSPDQLSWAEKKVRTAIHAAFPAKER